MKIKSLFNFSSRIKPNGLNRKITAYTLLPFVIVLILISSITMVTKYQTERELILSRIENYVSLLESGDLNYQSISDTFKIEEIIEEKVIAAGIVNRDNEILYATEDFYEHIDLNGSENIKKSLDGYIISYSEKDEDQSFYYFSPIIVKNKIVGVFILSIPFDELNLRVTNYLYFILSLDVVGIFIAFFLIRIFTKRTIIDKIKKLEKASIKIKNGDYQNKIENDLLSSNDEIGNLSKSFETMRNSILESKEDLENYNKNLEGVVKERTVQLQQKNYHLEEVNKKLINTNEKLEKTQNKLNHLNKNLELEVESRTKEIKKLLIQKDEFVNQLGHDLKTPLGPITNLLAIIIENEKNSESSEMLEVVNRNANFMKNLVLKTLKLAKLNAPSTKLKVEDVNLFDKINMTIKKNDNIFNNYNIKIKNNVSDKINIKADSLQIEELFDNIINNSIKYSPDGGTIAIDAKFENDFVNVSIKDEGNGMTPEQIVHVFDEFYKADWSRHDFDSSGLGLSICKRIVEKHGGRIWVESKGVGKGSTFYFNIPIENVSAEKNVSQEIDNFLFLRELEKKDDNHLNK